MKKKEIEETIKAFADCNMNISETARALYLTHNAVAYRLNRIKLKTGENPKEFWGLVRLLNKVKKGEIKDE